MGLSQENKGEAPQNLRWIREEDRPLKVFTDQRILEAEGDPAPRKIALLIEPPALRPWHYENAWRLQGVFEAIFTFNAQMINDSRFRFYPFGGSYLKEWGLFEKSKLVSIITSAKRHTEGHQLRHEIVGRFGERLDLFGEPYKPYFTSKADALRPYLFSVVVESERRNWYFTEKLIDCLSQGTIPIYWGCPDIGRFFNKQGILSFKNYRELAEILNSLDQQAYLSRLAFVRKNLELARRYRIAEDWIVENHSTLLNGSGA